MELNTILNELQSNVKNNGNILLLILNFEHRLFIKHVYLISF